MVAMVKLAFLVAFGVAIVYARPYDGDEVFYRVENQPRDPRSFKSIIQSTSRGAISLAQQAMKSFFPSVSRSNAWNEINGLRMNRRSVNEGDNIKPVYTPQPVATYTNYAPYQMMMVPAQYAGAQYYGGYARTPMVQYQGYQNTAVAPARTYIPYTPYYGVYNKQPAVPVVQETPNKKSNTADETQAVLGVVDDDADGFYDAISNTKEAFITKGQDGGIGLEEKIEGNMDSLSKTVKRNKIKEKKTRKDFQEDFKRALESKGDLENKLIKYFTNYICGQNC